MLALWPDYRRFEGIIRLVASTPPAAALRNAFATNALSGSGGRRGAPAACAGTRSRIRTERREPSARIVTRGTCQRTGRQSTPPARPPRPRIAIRRSRKPSSVWSPYSRRSWRQFASTRCCTAMRSSSVRAVGERKIPNRDGSLRPGLAVHGLQTRRPAAKYQPRIPSIRAPLDRTSMLVAFRRAEQAVPPDAGLAPCGRSDRRR
jgi:hypothetical protein